MVAAAAAEVNPGLSVVGRIMDPKGIHVLILRACEYVT